MNKRLDNFEALRIVAMFMVLVLHYLDKGGLLTKVTEPFTPASYVAYFLEALAIVAVNVYVMITGYFMCESRMKVTRLVQIICQVMWYSLLIPVVLALLGVVNLSSLTIYDWLYLIFPIHMRHYWFVTDYVVLLLFVPLLNMAIRHLSSKQLALVTSLLLLYQMFPKSILPVVFTDDDAGYGVVWFVCLYLIAAYIRKYGIAFFSSMRKSFVCYVAGALCVFLSLLAVRQVYFTLDAFGERINFAYHYNHIFCLIASVALFYVVKHWNMKDNKISRLIGRVAPYTFGVYLLHEHRLVGYNWTKWLGVAPSENILIMVAELVLKCFFVLVLGILLDWLRTLIFGVVSRVLAHTPLTKLINRMDHCLREEV